jgi:hypothetical protein
MKKTSISLLCLILCTSATFASSRTGANISRVISQQDYLGKWEGADHTGQLGAITFYSDGSMLLVQGGQTLGGKKGEIKDRNIPITYEFNFSKDPVWLDIIISDDTGKELSRFRLIVKFIARDKMLCRMSDMMTQRPDSFDENDKKNTILLTKVTD